MYSLSGNAAAQKLLERNVDLSLRLMGVGSASDVAWSGEQHVLVNLADRLHRTGRDRCRVFDVGANRGQYLQLIRSTRPPLPGPEVHCFEPSPTAFALLSQIQGAEHPLVLNNFGLSNEVGSAKLFAPKRGSTFSSLSKRNLEHHGLAFNEREEVNLRTLDEYCEEHAIAHIDLLKMDVEGHELSILRGGQRLLQQRSIDMITFEVGNANIDARVFLKDFWKLLVPHGFELKRLTPSGYMKTLRAYHEGLESFGTTVFVAELKSDGAVAGY